MTSACPLCKGSRVLRCAAPNRLEIAVTDEAISRPLDSGVRTYPCPACNKAPAYEFLRIVTVASEAAHVRDEAARYIRREQALALADEMLRTGAIIFEARKTGESTEYRSAAAVVSPSFVATLGHRLEERQTEFASEVVAIANRSIFTWGSYHGDDFINKDIAARLVREAIKEAAERRKSWSEWNGQSPATNAAASDGLSRQSEPVPNSTEAA